MQVIVKGRHTKVPAALKGLATEKVQRVQRFFDKIGKLEVEFSEEHNPRVKYKHRVEVTLAAKNGVLRATASGVDPASALDAVVDKLEVQVRRMKDKIVKRGRGHTQPETIRMPARSAPPSKKKKATGSDNGVRVESKTSARKGPRVRRAGRFSVEPMTPNEAAMQIDSNGDEFLPFVNAETDQVSVVYRTDDGGYALLARRVRWQRGRPDAG